ncbi:MAG TPA: HAMP domain-containing sensor histidine kinase [Nocardioides sp.]|nr:HAMP domain-containing sensor histidine kinase [Nocardioides sp.]
MNTAVADDVEDEADRYGWHYRRSLASRVTLLTTMAVGFAVLLVSVGAYVTVRKQLQDSLDDQLVDRARSAAEYDFLEQAANVEFPVEALGSADVRIALLRADNFAVALGTERQGDLQLGAPELSVARGDASQSLRTATFGGEQFRVVAVPTARSDGTALVMVQSLDERDRLLSRLGFVTLLFGGLGVLVAGIAGWAVARNGLRPVRNLTTAVEGIARTEQLRPIPIEGDDEVARLSAAFNQMLVALDASRERQRRLVADAGHELRTPLTSLRTNIDLLTQIDSDDGPSLDPQARGELLGDIRAQIDELTTLIGDLTELSRAEPLSPVVETIEVSEVLDHALARVRRRAPGVTFDVESSSWWLVGESTALERAITNVLDNAAKWSPTDGTVTVRLADGVLTVDDEGPGIKEEDRPHVFERFWRAAESRTMPGSGLGLSIVAQVAERHAGQVEVASSPAGGTRLILTLPGRGVPDE